MLGGWGRGAAKRLCGRTIKARAGGRKVEITGTWGLLKFTLLYACRSEELKRFIYLPPHCSSLLVNILLVLFNDWYS